MEVSIKRKTVGVWKENSYFISYKNEGWLVDPGDEFEALENHFEIGSVKLSGIINTHGHFDHIGAVSAYKEKYNIPFYIHSKEKQLVQQGNLYLKLAGGESFFITPKIDFFLDTISSLPLGDKTIKIHHTPGHTKGSVCFEIDNHIFSGDLFFKDSIGRTDLPGADKAAIGNSVRFILDNFLGYTIHPGHGDAFVLDEQIIKELKNKL